MIKCHRNKIDYFSFCSLNCLPKLSWSSFRTSLLKINIKSIDNFPLFSKPYFFNVQWQVPNTASYTSYCSFFMLFTCVCRFALCIKLLVLKRVGLSKNLKGKSAKSQTKYTDLSSNIRNSLILIKNVRLLNTAVKCRRYACAGKFILHGKIFGLYRYHLLHYFLCFSW